MGGGEEEEGREGQTHYVVEQFVAEVSNSRVFQLIGRDRSAQDRV